MSTIPSTQTLMADYKGQPLPELGTLIVLDGLPVVDKAHRPTLIRFLLRKLDSPGPTDTRKVYMPVDSQQRTIGSAIIRYLDASQAEDTITRFNGSHLDSNHQMTLEKIEVSERYRHMQNMVTGIEQQLGLVFPIDMETELFQEG
ncbi:unnamed protein product [Aspergillus oryzae RIB40]|uniref:DNA, SC001 n=2 Tax=Aspergillus oryzae TaxID=5062 RepID=Q2UP26_ASPOR|nr:unnamed protein product [Aspergillus oryzae RIB40]EIT77630.1 hypothetical protein Ao3042_06186 [Aspergillus oryzae 3.042]KDE83059.1 hypothetical protein AO1008_09538 [Aspergillus oryzae 100-8]BAE56689.1 unnamed protein product [Aspergillus oryzae RIB40]|eukprot:EIT77630.1 hypothetical protein Ao3042_06186 [Aspergillus oryzae 3.042]